MSNPGERDLREITRADVYIGDDLAGHLTRERGDNVTFTTSAITRPTVRFGTALSPGRS